MMVSTAAAWSNNLDGTQVLVDRFIATKFSSKILMVDSITFGHEMVNILVSGEEYDKVFNHLDMLNAPLEGNVFN
ncbi:hypothetical protein Tco_1537911, partial [Tanacetum coccineum]